MLESRKFFYIALAVFIFQAAWIAVSGLYPMAFDEQVHLGIIRLYASRWLPFWSHQPPGAAQFGAVARDPSYLYHYLMSFPYRFISLFLDGQMSQVIVLRFINIALFVAALVIFRKVLSHTKASKALIGMVFAALVLTPIIPSIAAQINYDNLLFLVTAIALLLTFDFVQELRNKKSINMKRLVSLLIVCLLASLVKYAFLPIFAGIVIYVAGLLYKHFNAAGRKGALQQVRQSYQKISPWLRVALGAGVLLGAGLFAERYGVNMVHYGTPTPECNQVLSIGECKADSAWLRNYETEQDKVAGKSPQSNKNPLTYTTKTWTTTMFTQLFFTINGPASGYKIGAPLAIPLFIGQVIAFGGGLLLVCYGWYIRKQYQLGLAGLVIVLYLTSLWVQNYGDFLHLGYPFGVQGRYMLPVLPFIYLIVGLGFSRALKAWPLAKAVLAGSVLVVLALEGGGFITFILRSDISWYWPKQSINNLNHWAQKIFSLFVLKS